MRKISRITLFAAYDSGAGWKKDDNGALVTDDSGNPVWLGEDGREVTVAHDTVHRLGQEAKQHRERAERAEKSLKDFEGLDPAKAREALETVGKLTSKELIEAGKVDEVKREITQQYEGQLSERDETINSLNGRLNGLMLDTAFKSSEFIRDNIAVPADLIQSAFASRFKVENDQLVPYGPNGEPVYSKKRAGEVASFDEALAQWIEGRSDRDVLLKAPEARGSGNNGGGGNRGGGRIVKRSDFDNMPPLQKAEIAGKMGSGEVTIVD